MNKFEYDQMKLLKAIKAKDNSEKFIGTLTIDDQNWSNLLYINDQCSQERMDAMANGTFMYYDRWNDL